MSGVAPVSERVDRELEIVNEIESHGMSFANVGRKYRLSRQRIYQICKKHRVCIARLKKKFPENYYKTITVVCQCGCGEEKEFPDTAANRLKKFISTRHYQRHQERIYGKLEAQIK